MFFCSSEHQKLVSILLSFICAIFELTMEVIGLVHAQTSLWRILESVPMASI